jgi:hypothetical protein
LRKCKGKELKENVRGFCFWDEVGVTNRVTTENCENRHKQAKFHAIKYVSPFKIKTQKKTAIP